MRGIVFQQFLLWSDLSANNIPKASKSFKAYKLLKKKDYIRFQYHLRI